ncbi:MAG: zf-HC2 domain-containing protein [Planctomycetota bacterium]
MNCADAKHLIHLDAGNDLRSDEESRLAEHMASCNECRTYRVGMASAMGVLLAARDSDAKIESPSVWSAVSREITKRRTSPAKVRRFNLQVAALSVCSLGLAVVTIVQSLSSFRSSPQMSGGYYSAQPVMNSSRPIVGREPSGFSGRNETRPMMDQYVPQSLSGQPQSF